RYEPFLRRCDDRFINFISNKRPNHIVPFRGRRLLPSTANILVASTSKWPILVDCKSRRIWVVTCLDVDHKEVTINDNILIAQIDNRPLIQISDSFGFYWPS